LRKKLRKVALLAQKGVWCASNSGVILLFSPLLPEHLGSRLACVACVTQGLQRRSDEPQFRCDLQRHDVVNACCCLNPAITQAMSAQWFLHPHLLTQRTPCRIVPTLLTLLSMIRQARLLGLRRTLT
jgi:hypothetical protein